ncbi:porin family protein [Microvirga sp. BT689]|uniref:outer membrane protein n=1 Tax=Microvirga arvi TaxID=2778731 RepID=UPI00195261DD|nr:outer membrane protein [Microvirga arvi]MBM6582766.1 porin family protein [Microvirga arvi]
MKTRLLGLLAATALATAGISAASAADLPSRAAPAPIYAPVPVFTWTGFYVGAQIGYGWNANDNDIVLPSGFVVQSGDFGDSGDGFLAGVHAGYNYQLGSFVIGVEGDVEGVFGDDDDDLVIVGPDGVVFTNYGFAGNALDWQGSIRARAGFAFDRALIYATGGFAFAGVSGSFGLLDSGDDTLTGWTLGAGIEYAFTNNLTTRLEYRYTSYEGGDNFFDNVSLGSNDIEFHTVRAGLSYKFSTY